MSARWLALAALALLAACETRGGPPAPVTQGGGTRAALSRAEASSGVIVAQRGDTLYAIARRANVPLRALIDANGLRPPYAVQAGQQLRLPRGEHAASAAPGGASRGEVAPASPPAPRPAVDAAPLPAPAAPGEQRAARPSGAQPEPSPPPVVQP
ncbi:MAG: LysM peptidoglycan-binding domain-containing protein, partial [Alphaproteobacteria bacterium]